MSKKKDCKDVVDKLSAEEKLGKDLIEYLIKSSEIDLNVEAYFNRLFALNRYNR